MSTSSVQSAVRAAITSAEPLRITGGGSWMNAGRPVAATRALSMSADKGVVDYVADDLTITVRAGTTLRELAAATAAQGQWLPLDPVAAEGATIGGTIATASSGPLSHSFGFARDFVLGLEIVTGKGDVVRSGGRVVKNVAGFDLMRLMCGAWGTLGVITEATVRLYAQPRVDRTFALAVPSREEAAVPFFESLSSPRIAAIAVEMIDAGFASQLGLARTDTVLVRIAGNSNLVDAQIKLLSAIGTTSEMPADVWDSFSRTLSAASDIVIRLSSLPGHCRELWRTAREILSSATSGFAHSTFSRGIVRVVASGPAVLPKPTPGQRVAYDLLPAERWSAISPSVISDPLSRRVQRSFDPHTLLNPGILG